MSLVLHTRLHIERSGRGASKRLVPGATPVEHAAGRVPRVAKLMALALRFDELVRSGQVADYAELARLGHVTRARISQISNLTLLAPDIIEALLHLPLVARGRDPIHLAQLQPIAAEVAWARQRELWQKLKFTHLSHSATTKTTGSSSLSTNA